MPVKRAAERFRRAEPAAPGNAVDWIVGAGQRALRCLDPDSLDVTRGRGPDFGGKATLQVTRAEASVAGQLGDTVPGARIGVNRRQRRPDRVSAWLPGPQRHAELRL